VIILVIPAGKGCAKLHLQTLRSWKHWLQN